MNRRRVMAVDPGKNGAIVLMLDHDPIQIWDMPLMKQGKTQVADPKQIHDIFNQIRPHEIVIENVTSFGQGRTSAFNFGKSVMAVTAAAKIAGYDPIMVRPQDWKPTFNLSKDKNEAREMAKRMFPEVHLWFKLRKHDGRAEACLIGYYHSKRTQR